jgi:hypothetical protein
MRRNEITLLLFIAVASAILAAVLANAIFGNPDEAKEVVPTVELLPSVITPPDPLVFNSQAVDPTATVCVGNTGQANNPECEDQFTPMEPPTSGETGEGEGGQ